MSRLACDITEFIVTCKVIAITTLAGYAVVIKLKDLMVQITNKKQFIVIGDYLKLSSIIKLNAIILLFSFCSILALPIQNIGVSFSFLYPNFKYTNVERIYYDLEYDYKPSFSYGFAIEFTKINFLSIIIEPQYSICKEHFRQFQIMKQTTIDSESGDTTILYYADKNVVIKDDFDEHHFLSFYMHIKLNYSHLKYFDPYVKFGFGFNRLMSDKAISLIQTNLKKINNIFNLTFGVGTVTKNYNIPINPYFEILYNFDLREVYKEYGYSTNTSIKNPYHNLQASMVKRQLMCKIGVTYSFNNKKKQK